jgi:hypothetical protein
VARKLDQAQVRELSAFVAELKALGGYEVSAEWARDSGYPAPNLSKLENGVGAIDGYNLLRLIRSSARRAGISPATAAAQASATARGADDAELVAELEELADLLERLQRLGSAIGRRASGA